MTYDLDLHKLIKERNKREHLFKDIIDDNNKLYSDYTTINKTSIKLQTQYDNLSIAYHNLKEMTKVTMTPGNLIVNDHYF